MANFDNISQDQKKDDCKILFMGKYEKKFNENEIIPPKNKEVLESRRGVMPQLVVLHFAFLW